MWVSTKHKRKYRISKLLQLVLYRKNIYIIFLIRYLDKVHLSRLYGIPSYCDVLFFEINKKSSIICENYRFFSKLSFISAEYRVRGIITDLEDI